MSYTQARKVSPFPCPTRRVSVLSSRMSHYRPLRLAVDALPTGAFTTPTLTNAPLHRSTLVTTKASPPPALPMPADACDGPDAGDYDWVPVLRRPRSDGWSPDKQRIFIETLADTACVTIAAQAVAMSASSAYRLRRARDGGAFAAAWDAALEQGAQVLISTAFDRAIHGSEEPVFDRDGNRVGRRFRQNDRLLMFLLRKLHPELFGDAGRDAPAAGSVRARRHDRPELADLIAALSPPRPSAPPDRPHSTSQHPARSSMRLMGMDHGHFLLVSPDRAL